MLLPLSSAESLPSLEASFQRQAALWPRKVAVVSGGDEISYRVLDRYSCRLAETIRERGVGPGVLVGIHMSPSIDLVAAMLGVLKAGGALVHLAPPLPAIRKEVLLEDCKPHVLLTRQRDAECCPDHKGSLLLVDRDKLAKSKRLFKPIEKRDPESLAYVVYTSGSTGRPRGVAHGQRGLIAYLEQLDRAYGLRSSDITLNILPPSADASFREIFAPLIHGGRLVVPTLESIQRPQRLLETIRKQSVSLILGLPPSILRVWTSNRESVQGPLDSVRLVMTCGETFLKEDHDRLRQIFGEAVVIVNQYGVTEVTQAATWYEVGPVFEGKNVPIGKPLPHAKAYLLGDNLESVASGEKGELCIGGEGLAKTFLGDPAQLVDCLVDDPFSDESDAKLYRTGDCAWLQPDGSFRLAGRLDDQVVVRGVRVEPAEVQATISQHPLVSQSSVVKATLPSGDVGLVAYFVPCQGQTIQRAELLSFLRARLPDSFLPAAIIPMREMPRTRHGKVDRQRLPQISVHRSTLSSAFQSSRTETESVLIGLWQELLRVEPIGVNDDFYELGGDSLLAIELLVATEKRFGISFPLERTFVPQSIASLAADIDSRNLAEPQRCMVRLNDRGHRPPVFAIGGLYGEVSRVLSIGKGLPSTQPFNVLHPPGMDWWLAGCTRIEEMAAFYVSEIERIHPRGPCRLMGTSFGGVVAFEIALQLQRRNRRVDFLTLVDTAPWMDSCEEEPKPDYYQIGLDGTERQTEALVQTHLDVSWQHVKALTSYRAREAFQGEILYFRSAENVEPGVVAGSADDRRMAWRSRATGGLTLKLIPGGHGSFDKDPQRVIVVRELQRALNRAERRSTPVRVTKAASSVRSEVEGYLGQLKELSREYQLNTPSVTRPRECCTHGVQPVIVFLGSNIEMSLAVLRTGAALGIELFAAKNLGSFGFSKEGVFLNSAVGIDRGALTVMRFKTPRPVGYLYNTQNVYWNRLFSAKGISVAFNNTFEHLAHNKTVTNYLLRRNNINIPRSYSFLFRHEASKVILDSDDASADYSLISVKDAQWPNFAHGQERTIDDKICALLADGMFARGAVVKPVMGSAGVGVVLLDQGSREVLVREILHLLSSGRSVMVQERIWPAVLRSETEHPLDWNYRGFISRDGDLQPTVIAVAVRAGTQGTAVNFDNGARCFSLEEFSARIGFDPVDELQAISHISRESFEALERICSREPMQDFASIDLVKDEAGQLYTLEMNGRNSVGYLPLERELFTLDEKLLPLASLIEHVHKRTHTGHPS